MSKPPEQNWTIEYYTDTHNRAPALEFIDGLPKSEQAIVLRYVDLLAEFGISLGMPHARHIDGRIWELRPSAERIFYAAISGRRFIILHGYRKKSNKTPPAEIQIAKARWDDFLEREK